MPGYKELAKKQILKRAAKRRVLKKIPKGGKGIWVGDRKKKKKEPFSKDPRFRDYVRDGSGRGVYDAGAPARRAKARAAAAKRAGE